MGGHKSRPYAKMSSLLVCEFPLLIERSCLCMIPAFAQYGMYGSRRGTRDRIQRGDAMSPIRRSDE